MYYLINCNLSANETLTANILEDALFTSGDLGFRPLVKQLGDKALTIEPASWTLIIALAELAYLLIEAEPVRLCDGGFNTEIKAQLSCQIEGGVQPLSFHNYTSYLKWKFPAVELRCICALVRYLSRTYRDKELGISFNTSQFGSVGVSTDGLSDGHNHSWSSLEELLLKLERFCEADIDVALILPLQVNA